MAPSGLGKQLIGAERKVGTAQRARCFGAIDAEVFHACCVKHVFARQRAGRCVRHYVKAYGALVATVKTRFLRGYDFRVAISAANAHERAWDHRGAAFRIIAVISNKRRHKK